MLRRHRLKSYNLPHRRQLHDKGVWGYAAPRASAGPDAAEFTPSELANRAKNANLLRLVESYRKHGHRAALLDPLDLAERPNVPALDPSRYGFALSKAGQEELRPEFKSETNPSALTTEGERFNVEGILDFPKDQIASGEEGKTIDQVAQRLREVYCSGIGYEFMHLPSKPARRFLETLLERSHAQPLSSAHQLAHWRLLAASETFDHWAAKRFPTVKRYGLEGAEGMMVALQEVFRAASEAGKEDVVLAMPHRGRLNVLTQMLGLDMRLLVRKMRGLPTLPPSLPASQFTDDVLSHLFISTALPSSTTPADATGMKVHLLPNPSHLETVTPVGLGFARGLQVPYGSLAASENGESYELGDKVVSLAVHGDAAFGGQGVVSEALNLADLPHFTVGGTVRIVVNNQLGYTTPASAGRSSFYATDLAKAISAPILHVNGDRVDDVARAMRLAVAYQQKYRKDVVIDLVVYRRRGHNELDEPAYTSPVMYRTIEKLPSVAQLYERQLLSTKLLSTADATKYRKDLFAELDKSLVAAKPENFTVPEVERPRGWSEMRWPAEGEWKEQVDTGVDGELLREVGRRSVEVEEAVTPHPRLGRQHFAKRLQSLEKGEGVDFASAEALAFGSLMLEGYHVRLCGQDSGRGTFSQRHAIVSDQNSDRTTVPLQSLTTSAPASSTSNATKAGTIEIVNSPLSEYAVIGFEQGLSYVSPSILPLWEAQFGDFHNTAQVAIDTYLGAGETKWGWQSALTLLLPHGYDSAGPEHSSARIERFLQLTNEPLSSSTPFVPNMHLVNVTTAAQYFHLLRRQMKREWRKPLVVFSPKGILRLPAASSSIAEMEPGTTFQPVLSEPIAENDIGRVKRVVFLTGKMYYDLVKERAERGLEGKITFVRIEELSPFPAHQLGALLARHSNSTSFLWAQEEPENAGAYTFVLPRLQALLPEGAKLGYAGREAMSVPAPGVGAYFKESKARVLEGVFGGL